MVRHIALLTVAGIATLLLGSAAHAAGCDAPLPHIQPGASPGLPESAAALGGVWQGTWPTVSHQHVYPQCARLYVNVVAATSATTEQCVGSVREVHLKAECKQYLAQIIGNQLTFTDFDGTIFSFTLADVGGMLAKQVNAEHRSVSNFNKAP